jgi:hypothetical protein
VFPSPPEITPSVSFEFGQENNNTIDATSYGKLTVKLPLGNKQKFTSSTLLTNFLSENIWYLLILTLKLARWYSKPRLRRL